MASNHDPRRRALLAGGAAALVGFPALAQEFVDLPITRGRRRMIAFPEKRPLIVLTTRPPQLETPFDVFNDGLITPNDAFFVRYHNNGLPGRIDGDTHVINIGGPAVGKPLQLTVAQLRSEFKPVEVVAVNQCSGNSRGLFTPRVQGGQLTNGAMGNARWVGVPLKDVLARAELKNTAKQVTFNGLDNGVMGGGDFVKALDMNVALNGEVMIAWQMNGTDLPFLNGFPVRLIVPGYYGTYWVKHLNEITVIDSVFDGYWMKTAYRMPDNDCNCTEPGTPPKTTIPIGRFTVRSFITSLGDGAKVAAGQPITLKGIAFDGGTGIKEVAVSTDDGKSWTPAKLGQDLGKYSFREWQLPVTLAAGKHELKVRATSNGGQIQPMKPLWNPAGYLRNVVETVTVTAA